jgi:hypothetical protein
MADASSPQDIALYVTPKGEVRLEVRVDADTVWLNLNQMAVLFDRHKSVISRHLSRVFAEGELRRKAVVAKNATTAADGKTYLVEYFNLDAIISVGYRVNSKRGTQFRIWATKTLRDHLIKGYSLNERRLGQGALADLEQTLQLLGRTLRAKNLVHDEGEALLDLVGQYARSWRILLQYDEDRLPAAPAHPTRKMARLTLPQANNLMVKLKAALVAEGSAGPLFGSPRGHGLEGVLAAIEQTFGGVPLYPSVEARAAHLLYFIIKPTLFAVGSQAAGKAATKRLDSRNILVSKQSARVTHRIRRHHGRSYALSAGPVTRLEQAAHNCARRRQSLLERRARRAARGGPSTRPRRRDRRSAPGQAQPAARHPLLSGDGDGPHDGHRRRLRGCRRSGRAAP